MRVGLVPLFGWMPHTAHFIYLAHALKALGHEIHVLTCDGTVKTCYNLEIKGGGRKALRCAACRVSTGLVGWQGDSHQGFDQVDNGKTFKSASDAWIKSSLRTLHRLEGDDELDHLLAQPQAGRLRDATGQTFERTTAWITKTRPDYVFFFNGRMDLSRGILEALTAANVPFASVERSFCGAGINVLPGEDCLGLKAVHRLTAESAETKLTDDQAQVAARFLFDRLKGRTRTEWRNYQEGATPGRWPSQSERPRIVILPSSTNEIAGSHDYKMEWSDPTDGYDAVVAAFSAHPDQVVIKGHPNWAQCIGVAQGQKITRHYQEWAEARGYHFIPPSSKARSADLMREADLTVVSHSSAAFEAGSVGRHIIAVSTAHYSRAGFAHDASTQARLNEVVKKLPLRRGLKLDKTRQRKLLRYIYTTGYRIPMFADTIIPLDARHCDMFGPPDLSRLNGILEGKALGLSEDVQEGSNQAEDAAIALLDAEAWPEDISLQADDTPRVLWPKYKGRRFLHASRRFR